MSGANPLRDAVFQKGVLIQLDFGTWTARTALKPEDLGLDDLPDGLRLGSIQLMDKKLVGRPASIHAVTRRTVDMMTIQWPGSEWRYASFTRLENVVRVLREKEAQFHEAVEAILDGYDERRDNAVREWVDKMRLFGRDNNLNIDLEAFEARIHGRFPKAGAVRKAFRFKWDPFVIEAPRDVKIAAFNEEANRRQNERIDEFVEDSIRLLRLRIGEVVTRVREVIAASGNAVSIPERSRKSILDQIEMVRGLNCFGDAEAEQMLARIEDELNDEFVSTANLGTLIDEVGTMAEADIGEAMAAVINNLVGDGQRVVEV